MFVHGEAACICSGCTTWCVMVELCCAGSHKPYPVAQELEKEVVEGTICPDSVRKQALDPKLVYIESTLERHQGLWCWSACAALSFGALARKWERGWLGIPQTWHRKRSIESSRGYFRVTWQVFFDCSLAGLSPWKSTLLKQIHSLLLPRQA